MFALYILHYSFSVNVLVNSAPRPGGFYVSPSEGVEFSTLFSFSASNWQDVNLPLTYSFGRRFFSSLATSQTSYAV